MLFQNCTWYIHCISVCIYITAIIFKNIFYTNNNHMKLHNQMQESNLMQMHANIYGCYVTFRCFYVKKAGAVHNILLYGHI